MRHSNGSSHPPRDDRYILVSRDEYYDYMRYRHHNHLDHSLSTGRRPLFNYNYHPSEVDSARRNYLPPYDITRPLHQVGPPYHYDRYHNDSRYDYPTSPIDEYPPVDSYSSYDSYYRPNDSVYYPSDQLEPEESMEPPPLRRGDYAELDPNPSPTATTNTTSLSFDNSTKLPKTPEPLSNYAKLNRSRLQRLRRRDRTKPKCPLDDITVTDHTADSVTTESISKNGKTYTTTDDKVSLKIDKPKSKKKDSETSPMAFVLPVQNKPVDKPSEDSGIFSMLFPQLQSKPEPKEPEPELPTHDRTKFVKGIPIDKTITSLEDLIEIGENIDSQFDSDKTYSLDLESLRKMLPCLCKLRDMIGLEDIKNKIIHQVLFYLQGLDETNKDMLHTVIEGDPGVGKTEIAKILGEIYCSLGILTKGTFTSVKRADLVGSYLGQTASKTLKVLEASRGGVLFIDEAYSLGNDEGKDIYSKECIDTITAFLSENRGNFVCVIAGYRDALKKCFFKHNAGLERRFPWRYSIKGYSESELKQIFEKIVMEHGWKTEITLKFFEEHMDKFKNFGGDMENLFHKSKLAHSMRSLSLEPDLKKNITMEDIEQGFKFFVEEETEKVKSCPSWYMYT